MTDPWNEQNPFDPTNITSILDTPEIRRQRIFDTLGGMGRAILQASMPHAGPATNPLQILAFGLAGGAQGAGNEDRYLKQALVGAQVAKARNDIANDQAWNALAKGGPGVPTSMPAAPATSIPPIATSAVATRDPTNPGGGGSNPFNIGNVRPVGSSVGFQQPATLEDGVRLAVNNVQSYPQAFNNGQPMSLLQIGQKWAPTGDGKNDPTQWAKNVAQIGGLPVDQPLDFSNPEIQARFARGVHGAEWGPNAALPQQAYSTILAGGAGPQIAQGGGDPSGNPIQPAQYQPPAPPQTLQDVFNRMPPAMRQFVGAMGRKEGMAYILKNYVEPGAQPALHIPSGQIVFAPKDQIGKDPNLAPADQANIDIKRQQLGLERQRTQSTINNAEVTIDPTTGQPVVNQPLMEARKAVSAAQGTDVNAYATKQLIDQTVKEHSSLQSSALQARTGLNQLDRLTGLLNGISTGKFTGTTTDVKAVAKSLGVDLNALGIDDNVGPAQAAMALANQFALQLRNPSQGAGMPGNLSNKDMEILQSMVPSLNMTPEGIKLLTATMRKLYQRSIETADIANKWMRSGKLANDPAGMYAEIQQYADKNPLFTEKDLPSGGMSVAPPGAIQGQGETPRIRRYNPQTGALE